MENKPLYALQKVYASARMRLFVSPEMEMVYRSLFQQNLQMAGIEDEFYPVGGAANHSLLYLISRCLIELPVARILEFGAGQTSILLDRLAAKLLRRRFEIITVEQDPFWASKVGREVRHRVIHAPLVGRSVAGRRIDFYDLKEVDAQSDIELAIVDGPTAFSPAARWNRIGAVEYLKDRLASQFVVIFDDTERAGESKGAELFARHLEERHIAYFASTVRAAKQQRVFTSERLRSAAYF
jgi:hypothetical protein